MLRQVTLTGIDNKTDIESLCTLQEEYPFVEYGLLISSSLSNKNINPRYPHLSILKRLKKRDCI